MFNPERLTLARNRRGLTKIDLAKSTGKVRQTITEYETGSTVPTDDVVRDLADALRFPVDFFYEPPGDAVPTDGASFRSLSRMTARQRDAALAVGTLGVVFNEWIEGKFDLPENDIPDDLNPGLIDPEGAAALVRTRWGLGESPIPNMLHLLESHGVRVFSLADECREVDAFSFWIESTPYICLATYKTAERAIFDAAHELGHLVLHRDHAAPRGRAEEREADAFASSFLMPRDDLIATAPRNPDLYALVRAKHRWRVSTAALNYRLHQLDFTSDWHYRELCIQISRLGRDRELDPLPRELSQTLTKVFDMMRAEGVTTKDIAKELHLHHDDLVSLTFGLAMTPLEGEGEDDDDRPERPSLYLVQSAPRPPSRGRLASDG